MSKRKFRYANQSSGQKQEKVHLTQEAMDKLASISQAAGIEDGVGFVFRDKRVGIEGEIIVSKKAFSFLGEEICKGLAKDAIGNMVNEYGQVSNWPEVKPMHYADIRTIVTYCNSVKSNFPYDFLSEHTFTFHLEDEKPKLSQEATDKITDCIRKMIEEQKGKVA